MLLLEMDHCVQISKSLLVIPQLCLEWTLRISLHLISDNKVSELIHKMGHYRLQFSSLTV